MDARELIAQLEQTAEGQDDLHARLIQTLKSYASDSESYLEAIELHIHRTQMNRSAVITEAAYLVAEREHGTDALRFMLSAARAANGRTVQ